jgi:nucleoid-associated protein YgaU
VTSPSILARNSENQFIPLATLPQTAATNSLQTPKPFSPTEAIVIPSDLRDLARNRFVDLRRPPEEPTNIARISDSPSTTSIRNQALSRDLSDEQAKRPTNYVLTTNTPGTVQELPTGRYQQEVPPAAQTVRPTILADKQTSTEHSGLTSLIRQLPDPGLFIRLVLDPGYRISRELTAGEFRVDWIGKPRGGYPIFGPLTDTDKDKPQGSALGSGLVSALDGVISTGKRGTKDGDHEPAAASLVDVPTPIKRGGKDSTDEEADEEESTVAGNANTQGSSEPDPTGTGTSGTNQNNADPSATASTATADPNATGDPNPQIIGAMILPELEIVTPDDGQLTQPPVLPAPTQVAPERTEPADELSLETAAQATDKNIRVDDLSGQLAEDTQVVPKPSKRSSTRKHAEIPESDGLLEGLLAAFLADENGKPQTDRITNRLLDDLFGDFNREEYVIKHGDTLESIATRKLKERRLAPLIYAINREALGDLDDYRQVVLVPGTVIQLPHFAEILRFRIHVIGDPTALFVYTQTNAAQLSGEQSIPNERLTYTCRLGDTLMSIAARHPLLQNPALWVLIAKANDLSTEVDKQLKPLAKIKRGETINLPTVSEIETFLASHQDQRLFDEPANLQPPANKRASPAVAPSAKFDPASASTHRRRQPKSTGGKSRTLTTGIGKVSSSQPMHAMDMSPVRMNTPLSRVITQNDLGDANDSLTLRLEVNHQNNWLPVIEYSVSVDASRVKFYSMNGAVRQVPIRLPTRAARELAENDMSANASVYCKKFLSGAMR